MPACVAHDAGLAEAGLADTLILMACGGRKVDTAGAKVPLVELYRGPMWSTLRKRLGGARQLRERGAHVLVLSGGLGFVSALTSAQTYEARLQPQAADALVRGGVFTPDASGVPPVRAMFPLRRSPLRRPWRAVIAAGGSDYRRVFLSWVDELRRHRFIEPSAPVYATQGGIGQQRAQLGRWLDEIVRPET
jgi:hypothetical protein